MNQFDGALVLEHPDDPHGIPFYGKLFGSLSSLEKIKKRNRNPGQERSGKDYGYGEVVFNTSMTGYQEILTDPSYAGQMICMTAAHIGNTGVNIEDIESKMPYCSGFICASLSDTVSSWRATSDLNSYLKTYHVPGIAGVDTRLLTKWIRSQGVTRGILCKKEEISEAMSVLRSLPDFSSRNYVQEVSTKANYCLSSSSDKKKYKVGVFDFGIKTNMLRLLESLDCEVEVLSSEIKKELFSWKEYDGIFLSNGPGDPVHAKQAVTVLEGIVGKLPIYGVCMGHQVIAQTLGAKTYKLKFGHRGANQPVKELKSGKVYITAQNHGYAVDEKSLPSKVEITHRHLNDETVAGIEARSLKVKSVQFHPEASPGPHDTLGFFEDFIEAMKK